MRSIYRAINLEFHITIYVYMFHNVCEKLAEGQASQICIRKFTVVICFPGERNILLKITKKFQILLCLSIGYTSAMCDNVIVALVPLTASEMSCHLSCCLPLHQSFL